MNSNPRIISITIENFKGIIDQINLQHPIWQKDKEDSLINDVSEYLLAQASGTTRLMVPSLNSPVLKNMASCFSRINKKLEIQESVELDNEFENTLEISRAIFQSLLSSPFRCIIKI